MLSGMILAAIPWGHAQRPSRARLALGAAAAAAPDLDLLGVLWGVPWEAIHRTATHSLSFALAGGIATAALLRVRRVSLSSAALVFACLLLHILLDLLCQDNRYPYGVMLFWPFSQAFFALPFHVIPDLAGALKATDPFWALAYFITRECVLIAVAGTVLLTTIHAARRLGMKTAGGLLRR
jgi:membrane-bound metal-dependent hydrolase YbcI (DUF457 family)